MMQLDVRYRWPNCGYSFSPLPILTAYIDVIRYSSLPIFSSHNVEKYFAIMAKPYRISSHSLNNRLKCLHHLSKETARSPGEDFGQW
jgi:hypothetical protein